MFEVRFLAAAVAGESGSAVRAADELRFLIRRDRLGDLQAVYVPAPTRRHRPILIVDSSVDGWTRDRYLAIAVGHVVLRHHALREYAYGVDGPRYSSPVEEWEVQTFAEVFAKALPARFATARERFAVVASGRAR